jgi:hypothetical protein
LAGGLVAGGLAAPATFKQAFSNAREKHPNTHTNNRVRNFEFFCTGTILSYLDNVCPTEESVSQIKHN